MTLVLEGLREAQNARDAAQVAALFTDDYRSAQPAHPNRGFGGSDQVLSNWSTMFDNIPDFTAELLAWTVDGATGQRIRPSLVRIVSSQPNAKETTTAPPPTITALAPAGTGSGRAAMARVRSTGTCSMYAA